MKKLNYVIVLTLLMGISGISKLNAQSPYEMSIGGILGNMNGASFKMFLSGNLALQADLGFKFHSFLDNRIHPYPGYPHGYRPLFQFWTIEVNPNLVYQGNIYKWNVGHLQWFAGGGLSIGYAMNNGGKFGVNAMGGAEFTFSQIPLTLQMDFRPGYGLWFAQRWPNQSYFDWMIGVSARYTF